MDETHKIYRITKKAHNNFALSVSTYELRPIKQIHSIQYKKYL
jgi:hypothetical protein